ncbi:hypothetical protein BRC81_00055 [Halobacteriales archaeon QS_1_68_20]|nr:MAG: hypothetical protein BRC81_00055 [Halobacteriales archaeon QS_1_68_20]
MLEEDVPFEVTAVDNVRASANDGDTGDDRFALAVEYDPDATRTAGVNQHDLFGSEITFGGPLVKGNVTVDG